MAQGTEEWLNDRKGKVTASVVAAIFGKSPFGNVRSAADTLCGRSTFTGNFATKWGSWTEHRACDAYVAAVGRTPGYPTPTVRAERFVPVAVGEGEEPYAGGSPDGMITCTSEDGTREGEGVLEIKCPHSKARPIDLPKCAHHLFQLQMNMIATGTKWSHFVSFTPCGIAVWRCPAAWTVFLGPLDALGDAEQEDWTAKGVYDAETGMWPGYERVFLEVVRDFHTAGRQHQGDALRDFAFKNYEGIRLVNAIHKALIDLGHVRKVTSEVFDAKTQREYGLEWPIVARGKRRMSSMPRQIAWTALIAWQMRYIADSKFTRRDGRLRRFARIANDGTVTHAADLVPRGTLVFPAWFDLTAVCCDIIHGEGGRRTKQLTLVGDHREEEEEEGTKHAVPYYPWERRELPPAGRAVVTVLRRGRVVAWDVVDWPGPNQTTTAEIPRPRTVVAMVEGPYRVELEFDPLGMYCHVRNK